jgi:AcrR family transcriptional regulator
MAKHAHPGNVERRDRLADAVLAIVARRGLHGLSHRLVDEHAGVPRGTASNYFRTRDAMLEAAAVRAVGLHFDMIGELRQELPADAGRDALITFLSGVVDHALTHHRDRYLAFFELALEGNRSPSLRRAFAVIAHDSMRLVYEAHRVGELEPVEDSIELLNTFYNGVLWTALAMPTSMAHRSPGELARAVLEQCIPKPLGEVTLRSPLST